MWVFLTSFSSCTCPVLPLLLWLLHFGVGYPGRPFPPTIPDRTQGTSPLLSCLPTSFRGFPSPFPSWGFGPRGNSIKRPFYKGLQHSLPLSLFTLPHLSSSLPQVFLFLLCVSGKQHRTLSYKHHVLSTSCSFPSGAQENIFFFVFPLWICLCHRLKNLFWNSIQVFEPTDLNLLFFLGFLVLSLHWGNKPQH